MCVKLLTNNFLSEKAIGKSKDVHLAVLRVLPEVIRESVDAEQHADYRKREGGKGSEGERRDAGRIVAVNQGKRDGSGVDADASSKSVIVYDPATGEKKMVSPTAVDGIESLGEVKTAEQREAEINAHMQDTIQRSKDWLEGNVANPVGMQIQLGDGRIATIEAMHEDGKSAIATLPDGTQFLVPKDVLQRIVNNGQYADYKARRDAEASKREAEQSTESAPETATEGGQPLPEEESREYAQGDVFDVVVDGQKMHAEIVSPKDADGRFVVNVDDGESMRTLYVTPEELAAMEYREEPSPKAEETRLATEDSSDKALERGAQPTEEHTPTALERIPRDEKGNAQFHDVDTETAWDGLVEMSGNEETAHKVAEASLANAERKLKAAKALKEEGETPEELLRSIKENEAAVAEAQRVVDAWKAIVGEKSRREEAAKAEAERIATEKAEAERKAAEERERAEAEEKTRIEAEKKEAERIAAEKAEEEARVEAERKAEEERKTKEEERKERDENGQPFVVSSDGTTTFGEITEDTGLTVAPIKLSEGVADEMGNGYGLRHIEARHGDQIRKAGFSSVEEFIEQVAKNYDVIKEGSDRNGNKTYRLLLTDKHNNTLMIELSKDGSYWNVNTAGVFKKSYGKDKKEVYNRHTTVKQSAETAETSQADEHSGTQSTSRMNVPTTSADKGSEISEEKQGKEQGKMDVVDVDNPQSWVGHTFTGIKGLFKGQQFVCEGLDGDKAVFHLKTADDDFKFSITKMRDMFARGWLRVENADLKRGNESVFDIAAAIAKKEGKEAAERQERMDGYTADMPPMRRARVRKTLGKELNYRNFGVMTEGEFVESMVAAGGIVTADFHNGKMRRLIDINDGELGHLKYPVSKAAADYAVYLGAKVNESELVNAKTEARMHEIRRKYADEDERGMFDNEEWLDREIGNSSRDKRKQERYEDLTEYKKLKEERDAKFNAHMKELEKKQKKQSVFDKAKEIADKEEKKRKAEAEDDSVLGQATRAVGKKKKVNLFKYTASEKISNLTLRGVHYANGYAYASDGYILFKEKADYPKEWEGTTRDKDGNLIDGKYPDAEKAIHRLVHIPDKEAVSLPSKEVLDFAIAASKKLKGEAIPVAIDGLFFNAVNLKKFLEAVASKGMDKIVYRHPMLYATNGKDEIVMMPTVNTLEGALDIADRMESAGLPKEQIDAWKAHIEAADKKMSLEDFKKAVENAKKEGVRPTEADKQECKAEAEKQKVDKQGNPIDAEGRLIIEKVEDISDLSDDDFNNPTRSVELPKIPKNVDDALGANGRPVIIKKNIFEKNGKSHGFTPKQSRKILGDALYNPDIVGQSQPSTKKTHWVAIKVDEKSPITILEVNDGKDNVEVVGWYTLDARNLERIKRQAEREGGELLVLSPKDKVESLPTPTSGLPTDKGSEVGGEKQEAEKKRPAPIAERIEDVGEKIGDARKDVWKEIIARIKNKKQGIEEALKKSSAGKLFSSLFDEKELLESGVSNEVVTFISAVKGSLGTKPRSLSKLKMWINKVLHQYDMCEQALENWESVKKKIDEWKYYSQPFYMYRAAMAVGGYESGRDVGNAELWQIADGYSDGKSVAGQWCVRKAGAYDGIYKTYEEAAEALKKFAGENAAVDGKGKRKEVKLVIYKRRTDGTMFIAPEGKPDVIIQDGFKTLYEASAYKKEHYAEMQERYRTLMDGIKPKFNENRERKGRDWRGGKDVSAEDFREAFDFRGVEFGNWMQQKDRRQALNECYDSLMDLAMVCGVSPKALSLGGKLAMAFGARGGGKFNAHYEPDKVVINLTKTKGAGSLAHEWFHAIDNYFNMQGWDEFATESTRNVERKEMAEAWKDLVRAINGSDYFKRSDKYARLKGSRYWIEPTELGARAFAVWVENRLSKYGTINDYLANNPRLVDEKASDAEKKYAPYPFDKDADWMDEKFGRLFEVMQERVDEETGKHILYSRNKVAGHEKTELTAEERELRDNLVERMRKGGLDVVTDSEEMQRVIDTENERTRNKRSKKSEAARKRDEALYAVDWSTAFVSGKSREEATEIRRERGRKFKEETKELYGRVLSGNFDDVTLRLIDEFIDKSTPNNPYGRPLSKRLPPRVGQKMRGGERTGSIDALFSRISESAVGKDGKALPRAERERAIEEKKKELLKKWAIATGNWHTDIADFTDQREPIGSGTDSDVYLGKDGKSVIKVSKGKPYGKRFRPDVDNVALFNSVFRNSAYTIVGYGEVDGKFVRFLKQPIVDFTSSTPLTEGERVAYMEKLGFKPINKENTAFSNGEIIASDLQKSNIVKDKQGNVRVIDADMKLHTKDFGGKFSYPDAETDTRTDGVQRFLRTADGEVYGLVKDGRIYLDPKVATAETAVHEYTHLWGDMLRRKDSEQWSHTVKELKNSVLWEEVKELYPELKTDDEIADEVLSTFSGRRGAERLREEARRVAEGDGGVFTKAKAIETLERVKEAIARFWEGVARMFGINRYRSAEELADMAMRDLLDSKNPMKDESGMRKRGEVGETLATSGTYFSGGGLLEAGLKGVIDPKVAVEFSEKIAGVYADNHGNHIVVADVRDVDPKKLVGAVDGGEVQYFHASPVCKNFSKAKREGGEVELDKETALSTAEFIAKTRPKVVTIENVKGYRNSEALKIITDELTRQGYDWDADVYNAADYGGYTKRERLIVRAKRDGKLPPKPEKLPEELRKKGWYSAVEDLIPHLEEKKTGVPQGTDERLKNSGIDYRTIDKPLYVFGRGYANKTVGHAFADELLPTLTTGGGDIIIMPDGRVLKASPRVLARVTGLPDTYKMPETDQLSHTIVGNGIPTQLTEGVIAPLLDNAIPSAERATKRESVFDVADRVSQNLEERTRAMGSRVEKRMADVAQKLEGRELTAEQKAVVDVFSGEKDNQKFSVERNGVKQQFLLKQGQEDKAGAKHSLYRHYGTNTGVITADDVLKIPQVLERGERIEKAKGGKKMAVYTMDIDGVKYTVLTRVGKNNEIVDDFYSNKKGSESSVYRNVENIDNTPEGARRKDSEPSAKVEDKSESPKLFGEEIIDDGKKGSDSIDRSVRENPKNEDKPRYSRKPGESIFDYASRVSEDVDRSVRERVSARDEYEKKVKSKGFQTKEALQNSMLGLQEFMSAIDHASGNKRYIEDIPDFENPILGENRLSSVNKEEMHQVAKTQFKPLMSAVAKLSGNGKESGELYDYMFAKHGLERDAVMRQREAQKEFDKYQKANPKGTKTIGDFVASLEGKDYAGLTALTAEDGRVKSIQSQIDAIDEQMKATDDQLLLRKLGGQKKRLKVDLLNAARDAADDIRKTFENNPSHDRSDINELWSRVNEVNGNTLRKLYESGLLTKEAYNDISSMYTNYIPMRGFDQTTSADAYAYLTHGDSAFNAPIKTAKGRSSKADNPIAYMQAMAESAIMQGNRNVLVKQKMLNFVRNHPSDLASVSDVWLQYDSVADEWKPVFPDNIGANDSASVVAKKMEAFEDKMKQMAEKHPDLVQRSNEAPDIPYKVVEKGQLNEHQVLVKQNGKSYIITVNGSPRAAQAANGLTNPDTDLTGAVGKVFEGAEALNRQLSSLYTTLNPDFIGSNYVRDALYSNTMVYVKEGAKYGGSFNLNFAKYNPAEMANLYARYNKGSLDTSNETHRLFLEFMQNGGETGFVNLKQIEKRKSEIAKAIKRDGRISAAQIWGGLSDAVDFANRAVENSARFAAYVTSRKSGRSVGRSVYDAKEISVNFNRKGSGRNWWKDNVGTSRFYDTEIGLVEINRASVGSSLAHRYSQVKLDVITSLAEGFNNAVYFGSMQDFSRQEGVKSHYFAYPINYNGNRNYVFCRAMQDANKSRLYVHEVFLADNIEKGNTLQTAASQPHGGITLYKDILANVLAANVTNDSETSKPCFSRKPGESIFDYASRVSEDVDRSVCEGR